LPSAGASWHPLSGLALADISVTEIRKNPGVVGYGQNTLHSPFFCTRRELEREPQVDKTSQQENVIVGKIVAAEL